MQIAQIAPILDRLGGALSPQLSWIVNYYHSFLNGALAYCGVVVIAGMLVLKEMRLSSRVICLLANNVVFVGTWFWGFAVDLILARHFFGIIGQLTN